jgi:hypothetical protein
MHQLMQRSWGLDRFMHDDGSLLGSWHFSPSGGKSSADATRRNASGEDVPKFSPKKNHNVS